MVLGRPNILMIFLL